ncbi:MAG: YdbL family protein [Alphaproteobacteria bacterium]|nr:YdbL family protein [Alphaproteobacteria bacterium]MDE2340097.1 YdbL family protein [Alphaproteobacteria bacterium]
MSRPVSPIIRAIASIALSLGAAAPLLAQTATDVSAAKAAGAVGEQADGYLGFKTTPTAALKSEVDSINIKRRAAYTQIAISRGVTVKEAAAAVGCQTLKDRVADGQVYKLPDENWYTKGATAITLPAYCGQ